MTPADAGSRPGALAPKIVSEVHELHRRNIALARDAGGMRGRKNRRERREAKEAESDLLRVLGFDSYESFQAQTSSPEGERAAPPALALVELGSSAVLDAQETEAALLRVLRAGERGSALSGPGVPGAEAEGERGVEAEPGSVDELRARVAFIEEELAETRFELLKTRDRVRGLALEAEYADPVDDAVPAAAAALVQVAAELRSLCEILRDERAQVAALGAGARDEAERILDRARVDARRLGDEAAVQARAVLDQASADAVALTRNAISTVDGLRRLADETGTALPPATPPL